jgi:hypothetical protein
LIEAINRLQAAIAASTAFFQFSHAARSLAGIPAAMSGSGAFATLIGALRRSENAESNGLLNHGALQSENVRAPVLLPSRHVARSWAPTGPVDMPESNKRKKVSDKERRMNSSP